MLRLALIGAGMHSMSSHCPALKAYATAHPGEIELTAVCDLDAGKAAACAARFGFLRVYSRYQDMLAQERLDGVIAITPVKLTATIAADLLTRGVPLLMEKPPGERSEQTRQLLGIAEAHGTPNMVSFDRRFIPPVVKARQWLSGPGRGRAPKLISARMLRHAREEEGFVVATGIHVIDTVSAFMGCAERIFTRRTPCGIEGRFLHSASAAFADGTAAHIVISPNAGVEEETFEIHGDGYCIQIDRIRCSLRIDDGGREAFSWQALPDTLSNGALGETEAFIHAIREQGGFHPDLKDALASMKMAEAIESGGDVAIEPEPGTADV